VDLNGTLLDPTGFAVSESAAPDETPLVAATPSGKVVFLYDEFVSAAPYAALRLTTRAIQSNFYHFNNGALSVDGTAGADAFSISVQGTQLVVTRGSEIASFPAKTVTSIVVNGLAGDDTLNFSGNVNAAIDFRGGAGNNALTVASGTYTFVSDPQAANENESLTVNVSNAGIVNFNATGASHVAALNVGASGVATLVAGASNVLVTQALSVAPTGKLDLFNGALVIDYHAGASGVLAMVEALIRSARSNGSWQGFGLTSTAAAQDLSFTTALGSMEGSSYRAIYGAGALFSGVPIDDTSALVKYTFYGDTDLSGRVNFDDYVRTDNGFNSHLGGWMNGDFDYNGQVNFDDYVLIDLAFNTQSGLRR
jgi:hypothetical protein